jgi:hypothetical protein
MTYLLKDKTDALESLNSAIIKAEAISNKVPGVTTGEQYDELLDEHETWLKDTKKALIELFGDAAGIPEFGDDDDVYSADETPGLHTAKLAAEIQTETGQLKKIVEDINSGKYPPCPAPAPEPTKEKNEFEKISDRLKNIKVIAIILVVVAALIGFFELINKFAEAKKNVFGEHHERTDLISIKETMGLEVFMLKDGKYEKISDPELSGLLEERHTLDTVKGHLRLHLVFVLSQPQQQKYQGLKFRFSQDFYDQLGGDKAAPKYWDAPEVGNYREYISQVWQSKLDFTINYDIP